MTTFDAGELGAGDGEPAHEVYFKESVYGPVSGTVTVKGAPYAVANDAPTAGREPAGELAFSELDSEQGALAGSSSSKPPTSSRRRSTWPTSTAKTSRTSRPGACRSSLREPTRACRRWATANTTGRGFLSLEQHPHEVDPASGLLLNWNNKPAPEWGAASNNYSYGPVQRVQLYTGFKKQAMNEAKDVRIMNTGRDARICAPSRSGRRSSRCSPVAPRRANWPKSGRHRHRHGPEKGASLYGMNQPESPAAAVMDADLDADRRSGARSGPRAN